MNVKGLADVFVASGINEVNEKTFTALFYGYEIRVKVIVPSIPTVEFFFYGNIYIDSPEQTKNFIEDYESKFGHAKFRFSDKFISILIDIGSMDAPKVKERLSAVGNFMISNGFGAIGLQPEEPEPEPAVDKSSAKAEPQPKIQPQQQRQIQQQPQAPQQPVYQEPQLPFEDYKILEKLTQIFLLGVNKVSNNTFTTIYHGYNVVGKMLSPIKDDIEIIFYGELMKNVTEEFQALQNELNEKYGRFPIRMVGGSCDAILYLEGKDINQCKEMLGQISGFMIRNNIIAINLPNTVGKTIATYTAESLKSAKEQRTLGGSRSFAPNANIPSPQSYNQSNNSGYGGNQSAQEDENNFVGKFLKKFSKKT